MDKRNFPLKGKDWMSGNWEISKFGLQILTSIYEQWGARILFRYDKIE
jgi:hypothetical protein